MILLRPSAGIKKYTDIDFDILSDVMTTMFRSNHRKPVNFKAKIYKSRQPGVSLCETVTNDDFVIFLDQTTRPTRKFIFGSILHELRHCCQLHIWKYWPDSTKFKTYEDYFRSKEEVDARKIEKLTRQVMKVYDMHVAINKKYKSFGLTKLG